MTRVTCGVWRAYHRAGISFTARVCRVTAKQREKKKNTSIHPSSANALLSSMILMDVMYIITLSIVINAGLKNIKAGRRYMVA